jgi:hypothetical protein
MTVLHTNAAVALRVVDPDSAQRWVFPVISVSMTWAINEIPICNLELGIGRSVNRNEDEQLTESAVRVLTPRRECSVVASFNGDFAPDKPWPTDATVIFRGNCVGVSNSLTRGRAALAVTLHHWLQHLQFSTILGGYAVPGDPGSKEILAVAFGFNVSGNEALAGDKPLASISQLAAGRSLFDNNFYVDLWGAGIKPLIDHLITQPLTSGRNIATCEDVINQPSPEAIAAWRAIEGPEDIGTPYSRWAVPLSLTGIGGDTRLSPPVLESISHAIAHAPIDYARQTDIWSQLVMRYCADYGTMVVPRVESAIVAPRVDALRPHYCYEIDANSIYQIDGFEPRQLPLAYIGVIADYESATGSEYLSGPLDGEVEPGQRFVACYPDSVQPQDPSRLKSSNGLTQFVSRPAWLANVPVAVSDPLDDFAAKGVRGGVANTGETVGEDNAERDEESRQTASEASVQVNELLRRYARMKYNQMIVRGRALKIIGKLRFDIGPGSTVAVNVNPAEIIGLQIDAPRVYGLVSRITIAIDAKQKLASTVFQLSNVRTEMENNSPDYASDNHPLYSSVFLGAPIVEQYALGAETEDNPCPQ